MFSLCLCPHWKNAGATWLKLPYSIQEKEQVLAILGIDSLKECVMTQIRSAVPTFEYTMFEFEPNQRSYVSYGRVCLEQLGVDLDAEVFRNFDFERYGEKQLIKNGMVLTSYGVIKCDPLYKEDPEYNLPMGLDLEM